MRWEYLHNVTGVTKRGEVQDPRIDDKRWSLVEREKGYGQESVVWVCELGIPSLTGGGARSEATLESMYCTKYSCLGFIVRWSPISFFEISTLRAKGALSGVIGNNRSKGKMGISEHGSHDAVDQK